MRSSSKWTNIDYAVLLLPAAALFTLIISSRLRRLFMSMTVFHMNCSCI